METRKPIGEIIPKLALACTTQRRANRITVTVMAERGNPSNEEIRSEISIVLGQAQNQTACDPLAESLAFSSAKGGADFCRPQLCSF
jgi:hypothetical protein